MVDSAPYDSLTQRELEILRLLAERLSDREIAERLVVALTTVKWYNRQIFNKLGVENRREAIERAQMLGLLGEPLASPKHNLPAQTTPFVGRTQEMADVSHMLAASHTRLVTILAPGGMGKTRLALATGGELLAQFANGVYFVPLAPLTSTEHIIPTIAEYTGFQFSPDSRTPKQQLLDYFREKSLLLILDNFEHLLEGAPLVSDILQAAPGVKIITTSRERLNMSAETVYTLVGMDYPESAESENALDYSAVQLFVQSAQRVLPQFLLNGENDAVVRMCRMLHGMPLAIELAAAWVGALSPGEIAEEITRSLDFLRTSMRDVPERLRSVRAVFESSWGRLTEDEQSVFRKLSVFRGGCTREAAQAIADANINTLTGLVDKALLWRNPESGRYEVHELLRQYAEQELEATGEADATRDAHMGYYARFANEWCRALKSPKQLAAVNAIETDIENIRRAFARAVGQGNPDRIEAFIEMWYFYEIQGWLSEGERAFAAAIDKLKHQESATLGKLLGVQAFTLLGLELVDKAREAALQSIDVLQRCGAPSETFLPLLVLARFVFDRVGFSESKPLVLDALQVARQNDDPWEIGYCLYWLGNIAGRENDHSEVRELFTQAYDIMKSIGDEWGTNSIASSLANFHYSIGNYDEATRLYEEVLAAARKSRQRLILSDTLSGFALVVITQGQLARGRGLVEESLKIQRDMGLYLATRVNLTKLAEVAYRTGNYQEATHHLLEALHVARASKELFEKAGVLAYIAELLAKTDRKELAVELNCFIQQPPQIDLMYNYWRVRLHKEMAELQAGLSPDAFTAAWERGKSLDLDVVIASLLGETEQSKWSLVESNATLTLRSGK